MTAPFDIFTPVSQTTDAPQDILASTVVAVLFKNIPNVLTVKLKQSFYKKMLEIMCPFVN